MNRSIFYEIILNETKHSHYYAYEEMVIASITTTDAMRKTFYWSHEMPKRILDLLDILLTPAIIRNIN